MFREEEQGKTSSDDHTTRNDVTKPPSPDKIWVVWSNQRIWNGEEILYCNHGNVVHQHYKNHTESWNIHVDIFIENACVQFKIRYKFVRRYHLLLRIPIGGGTISFFLSVCLCVCLCVCQSLPLNCVLLGASYSVYWWVRSLQEIQDGVKFI